MDRRLIIIALGLALAGCTSSGLSINGSSGTQNTSAATQQVSTATAKRQDIVGYSFFNGQLVIPKTAEAVAFSPYDTPVESVPVQVGQLVRRGQTIVKLTIPGADEAAAQAKADVQSARASLSENKAQNSEPVQEAKQALDQARQAEQQARQTVQNGGTADVDAATQARIQAEQNLQQAQQQLNQTVQPSKADVVQSEEELSAIKADARKGYIRAPITGTVVSMSATPGSEAKSNQTLATIINFEAVRIDGIVPPDLKDEVHAGTKVMIALNGNYQAPVNGHVLKVTIAPPSAGQASPGYLAEIRFDDPRQITDPNISIKSVGVRTGSVDDAIAVPVTAVYQKNGQSYVKVQQKGQWVETPVQTGLSDGVVIEIKSGVNEGDVVQVMG